MPFLSEVEKLSLNKQDYQNLKTFYTLNSDKIIVPFEDIIGCLDFGEYLAQLKTALMLEAWINEEHEERICEEFKIGPGDIRRIIENCNWLLYCSRKMANLFGIKEVLLHLILLIFLQEQLT